METKDELHHAFGESQFELDNDEVLNRLLTLGTELQITPIEVSEWYEIFALKRGQSSRTVTHTSLTKFEQYIRKEFKSRKDRTETSDAARCLTPLRSPRQTSDTEHAPLERTPPPRQLQDAPYLSTGKKFTARKKSGHCFRTLNTHLPDHTSLQKAKAEIMTIDVSTQPFPDPTTYMSDSLKKKAEFIEKRIDEWIEAAKLLYDIDATHSLNVAVQESVWMCGMVCCDSDSRLNASSITLLGSRTYASAVTVRMDISMIQSYSLFPGQILLIKASNPRGNRLHVIEIVASFPHVARSVAEVGDEMDIDANSQTPFSVLVAAGPFSSSEDLSYQPLTEIISLMEKNVFDTIILIGPFLDEQHPVIQSGQLKDTFSSVVQRQIHPLWDQITERSGRVVVIPSIRDVHHKPLFPQPPFDNQLHPSMAMLSNPVSFIHSTAIRFSITATAEMRLWIDGITFGICSHDVIKGLSMSTCEKEVTDRLDSLFRHLIGQRSFYPLFPPQTGACLDATYTSRLKMNTIPDVLITPSDLVGYAKFLTIDRSPKGAQITAADQSGHYQPCLCINPGRLVKGTGGGTYAVLTIAANETAKSVDLEKDCRVDIVGI